MRSDVAIGPRVRNAARFFDDPDRYLARNHRIELRAAIVRELLGDLKGCRILDLGCGDGTISAQFLLSGNHVTFVDRSASMLSRARRNVPAGCEHRVEYLHADIAALPAGVAYDVVLCIGVFAHVDAPEAAIRTVADVLKPGGLCVLQVSDAGKHLVRLATWVCAARKLVNRSPLRYRAMTFSALRRTATRCGLEIVRGRRHLVLLVPGMARLLGRWLVPYDRVTSRVPVLRRFGGDVIVLCRKREQGEC
jgi:2-polyprenyl-3-methyl-5-hydroxy-6-metoxy-1,4-benzoquinol methylase